jgi:hypothetical protein
LEGTHNPKKVSFFLTPSTDFPNRKSRLADRKNERPKFEIDFAPMARSESLSLSKTRTFCGLPGKRRSQSAQSRWRRALGMAKNPTFHGAQ